MVLGRRTIWLPQRWQRRELGALTTGKSLPFMIRRIRWFERFSRPRGRWLFGHRLSGSAFGVVILGLALTAFLAPPFSGLDTLPSLGIVVLALGYLLTDVLLSAVGAVIGLAGVASVVFLGSFAVKLVKGIF